MTLGALRVLIVDDESLARRGLKLRLDALAGGEVVGECSTGEQALAAIGELLPDLVFLDIQMPGLDGLEVVRRVQSDIMPLIVFVTAFDHFAVQAFELQAADYLLKPVEPGRLQAAVDRARNMREHRVAAAEKARLLPLVRTLTGYGERTLTAMLADPDGPLQSYPQRLTVRDDQDITLIPMADIQWVDAAGDYMCVHAAGETHIMRSTMKALEAQLDPTLFARIHRSTVVSIRRVSKVSNHANGEFFLTLECGTRLKVSRSYRASVERILASA